MSNFGALRWFGAVSRLRVSGDPRHGADYGAQRGRPHCTGGRWRTRYTGNGKRLAVRQGQLVDGLPPPDEHAGGRVSVARTRSGGVTITHAAYILVESEHLYLIIEGSGPSWATLHAPEPELEKNVLGADDIGEAGGGAFVGWAVHIDAENRSLVYRLTAYLQSTASYEAHRQR